MLVVTFTAFSADGLQFSAGLLDSRCPLLQLLMHVSSQRKKKTNHVSSVLLLMERKQSDTEYFVRCLIPVYVYDARGCKPLSSGALQMPSAARGTWL